MKFSYRLKELRNRKKLEREELAEKLGLSYSAIAKYETGKREPDIEMIEKIASFFDVTTDYLLGYSADPLLTKEEEKEVNEEVEQLIKMIETLPEEEQKQMWDRVLAYARGVTDARNND